TPKRDSWSSRLGVILAVSGSAIGLGNLLLFPGLAAQNGGGAFLIPYFLALVFLGIPLCWVEWTMGRYGGRYGHGSAPGIFNQMWKQPCAKYVGVIGLMGPMVIFFWYSYVEAWCLGYAYHAILGDFAQMKTSAGLGSFLDSFISSENGVPPAYKFFIITVLLNFIVIYFGVSKGIEKVSKFALPLLAILSVILLIRVLTLGTPDPAFPERSVLSGLGFVWNPSLEKLKEPKVWLTATGQVFFTLSVGIGVILTYASYIKKEEDIALSGLSACSVNTFFEVIIGGSVVVVAACVFFGTAATVEVSGSPITLGFISMPRTLNYMPGGQILSVMWFILLFIACLTSSISILQPPISFMEDEFGASRRKSVALIGLICIGMAHFAIFSPIGIDELDFWSRNVFLVLFGLIEAIIFGWIFGIENGFKELHRGAEIKIPRFFKFTIKYITPTCIIVIFMAWLLDTEKGFWPVVTMNTEIYPEETHTAVLLLRIALIVLFILMCWAVAVAFKRQSRKTMEDRS
ncbi:MAG: sodium-dependent transporter, partial [Deltaproteobacteria bacterium]|nr:sodium-dependent transporter [Deltaproteobacteria bacterium]